MPNYETMCVLHPELPEARVKEVISWMQKIVQDGNGSMSQVEEWGMRELAFPVRKQSRGYYVRLEYNAAAQALKELERNLRLSEDVLRFLSVVRPSLPPPSPQATQTPPTAPSGETETETSAEEQ